MGYRAWVVLFMLSPLAVTLIAGGMGELLGCMGGICARHQSLWPLLATLMPFAFFCFLTVPLGGLLLLWSALSERKNKANAPSATGKIEN